MKKVLNNKGFTLVEMLACTVTLLLLGLICTTGLNLAMNSYHESVFESNSQMFESTMNLYLGDILRHATDVKIDPESADNTVESLSNSMYQISNGKFFISQEGYLCCTIGDNTSGAMVASKANYAEVLCITDFELHYNDATGVFEGKYIIGSTLSANLQRECSFLYRTIAD